MRIRPSFNLYHRNFERAGPWAPLIPHSCRAQTGRHLGGGSSSRPLPAADRCTRTQGGEHPRRSPAPWAATASQCTSSGIHVRPRLFRDRGLLGAPSPWGLLGTPKVHKTHIPHSQRVRGWVSGAFLFSTVACPPRGTRSCCTAGVGH